MGIAALGMPGIFLDIVNHSFSSEIVSINGGGILSKLNRHALGAIQEVLQEMLPSPFNHTEWTERAFKATVSYIADGATYAMERGRDLNQMATDKAWPIFWTEVNHSYRIERPNGYHGLLRSLNNYTRESAGSTIRDFRERDGVSRNLWKAILRRPHYELFFHTMHSAPWDIYFPPELLKCSYIGHPLLHDPGALRSWFLNNWGAPMQYDSYRCERGRVRFPVEAFEAMLRDISDLRRYGEEAIKLITNGAASIDEIQNRCRYMEANHDGPMTAREAMRRHRELLTYGVSPAMANMVGVDFARDINGFFENHPLARPNTPTAEKAKRFKWLDDEEFKPPKEITFMGCYKATLIDTDFALYMEGKTMRHCIWTTYSARIEGGSYIAYHISGPDIPPTGYTVGLTRHIKGDITDIVCYGGPPVEKTAEENGPWSMDQVRGYTNNLNENPHVKRLANILPELLNGETLLSTSELATIDETEVTQ